MPSSPLARRLRSLRQDAGLSQGELGGAIGASVPAISSWENGTVPPPHRLEVYARFFGCFQDGIRHLVKMDELDDSQRVRYDRIHVELRRLIEPARSSAVTVRSPLQFNDGETITVVCSELPPRLRSRIGNEVASDPDHVDAYKYADLDALLTLLPWVTQRNPSSVVRFGTADEFDQDDLTAHLILLGGVDWNPVTADLMEHLHHIPVRQTARAEDEDTGGFTVGAGDGTSLHEPIVVPNNGAAKLVEDVAHFLRMPNPYNRRRTLTIFNGMFSRGSHGMVRALTDGRLRDRNAEYVAQKLSAHNTCSVVSRVRIVAKRMVVPDWTMANDRLHVWSGDS